MEKIIKQALMLAGFQNPEVIMTVLNATPNPIVAAEMIIGVYTPMEVKDFGQYWISRIGELPNVCMVEGINQLLDEVTLTSFNPRTHNYYYASREDYVNNTNGVLENEKVDGVRYWGSKSRVSGHGHTTCTTVMKLPEFNEFYKEMTEMEFFDTINQWLV